MNYGWKDSDGAISNGRKLFDRKYTHQDISMERTWSAQKNVRKAKLLKTQMNLHAYVIELIHLTI